MQRNAERYNCTLGQVRLHSRAIVQASVAVTLGLQEEGTPSAAALYKVLLLIYNT